MIPIHHSKRARSVAPSSDYATVERNAGAAFDAAGAGMALTDLDGRFLRVNDALCELLGRHREALLDGASFGDVIHADGPRIDAPTGAGRVEARFIRPDGDIVWALVHVTVMPDEAGAPVHLLATVQETTESKRLQVDLARLALQDPLTGLANRLLLDDRLRAALARAGRTGSLTGVLFLDLDGFKGINDAHGHHVGDQVLRAVGARLRAVLRPADVVARLGGDEFVAVCEELDSPEEARAIAARAESAVTEPIPTDAGSLRVSASIGLGLAGSEQHAGADDLIRRADEAMYRAKQSV